MTDYIYVGPMTKGLKNNVTPFNIDNDNFPVLINAYQWRDRVKRKRGTSFVTRLTKFFDSTNSSYGSTTSFNLLGGAGNLLTAFGFTGNLVPGSISFFDATDGNTYTDDSAGNLVGDLGGTGSIDYASGNFTVDGAGADLINTVTFRYYPQLPVMGLPNWFESIGAFPSTLAFDTEFSYIISTSFPYPSYNVSFYKNPPASTLLPGYVPKTNITPTSWNGQTYQQFESINYENVLWTTNGVPVLFNNNNIGMQFKLVEELTALVGGPPAIATFKITAHGLDIGDYLFFNEFTTSELSGINFQTGYVIDVPDLDHIQVQFPLAVLAGPIAVLSTGIAQYLTNRSDDTKDCLRWWDGDPTDGNSVTPVLDGEKGWVNFCPPLSQSTYSVAGLPEDQYYLVGAKIIINFKDRFLALGPVVQSSSRAPRYLEDTFIFSQNGTPFYTASFAGDPIDVTTVFRPLLVPDNKTGFPPSFFEDITGYGGYLTAGVEQPIITSAVNEDVVLVGFESMTTKLVYTGNDYLPFNLFIINSEYGSSSTFSTINLDEGAMAVSTRAFTISSQNMVKRIDLDIPDEAFEIRAIENGNERFTAVRDFINEWVYFTFPANDINYTFPTKTLQFNYRDLSWAIFLESYTSYGTFYLEDGYTWSSIGSKFPTWAEWNEPWNAGATSLLQPKIIGGNQQGFVLLRDEGTGEGNSLAINEVNNNVLTVPDHCLNEGDYIIISGALGTAGDYMNGTIFSVQNPDTNTFSLNRSIPSGLSYQGGGVIKRMYVPFVQTKQFPVAWSAGRKTRLGEQKYLLTKTANGEITVNIYLSQDADEAANPLPIYPSLNSTNDSVVYTDTVSTAPVYYVQNVPAISLGNLGNGTDTTLNLSLFQIFNFANEIIPESVFISVGSVATFSDDGTGGFNVSGTGVSAGSSIDYGTGVVVLVFSVAPNAQPSTITFQYNVPDIQAPNAIGQSQIWHRMNTSLIGDTVQLGFTMDDDQMRDTSLRNQFSEIELHGILISVYPSQGLA